MIEQQPQQETNLVNEEVGEDIESVGGYIVKSVNPWDSYDQQDYSTDADDVVGEAETTEPSTITEKDEVDLSIFDELDKVPEAVAGEAETKEDTPTPPGFEKFSEDFKKYMGFDMKEAKALIEELQTFRVEVAVKEQERQVKNAWGVDDTTYTERMQEVRKYAEGIQKKNPELFKKLDNPEGVQLIWSKLQQGKSSSTKQVPTLQSSSTKTVANSKGAYDFTMSQLQKMSNEEYAKNSRAIERAFANGRVNLNR